MNYRDFLQKVIYAIINPLIKAMIAVGITPNIVTFVGFLGNTWQPVSSSMLHGCSELSRLIMHLAWLL